MKILQAALSYEKGGRTRRIVDLGKGLSDLGHDVVFCALSTPPKWVVEKHPELAATLTLGDRPRGLIANMCEFTRLVKKVRPQVIHAHCATSRLLAAVAGRLAGIPVVGTFHHSILGPYARKPGNWLVARLLSHVVAISSNRQRLLANNFGLGPERMTLVHGGTEVAPVADMQTRAQCREQLGIAPDELVLLSLGHLGEIKGHDYVLAAMPAVIARVANVHLYIGGQGSDADFQRLEALIARHHLQQHVTLLGEIMPKAWYDAADIFVLASIEEGFGLVFIEAAARCLPVVATDTGGIADIVINAETGLLVPVANANAITDALLPLLEDAGLRTRYGLAARQRVEQHFLVAHMVNKYLAIYRNLTDQQ